MRHERPLPGRPTPVEAVNVTLLKKALAGAYSRETRAGLGDRRPDAEIHETVIADMVELLDQGRMDRGYADIYDLHRAGYHAELSATLGPHAAKVLAARVAERGEDAPVADGLEAA